MKIGFGHTSASVVASIAAVFVPAIAVARPALQTVELNSGWRMQFANKTPQDGAQIASANAEGNSGGVTIEPNRDAESDLQPATGFAVAKTGLR